MALPSTILFDYPSVEAVCSYILASQVGRQLAGWRFQGWLAGAACTRRYFECATVAAAHAQTPHILHHLQGPQGGASRRNSLVDQGGRGGRRTSTNMGRRTTATRRRTSVVGYRRETLTGARPCRLPLLVMLLRLQTCGETTLTLPPSAVGGARRVTHQSLFAHGTLASMPLDGHRCVREGGFAPACLVRACLHGRALRFLAPTSFLFPPPPAGLLSWRPGVPLSPAVCPPCKWSWPRLRHFVCQLALAATALPRLARTCLALCRWGAGTGMGWRAVPQPPAPRRLPVLAASWQVRLRSLFACVLVML